MMWVYPKDQNNVLTKNGRKQCNTLSKRLFNSPSTRASFSSFKTKTEDDVKKHIKAKGFEFIGEGIGRSVFHLPSNLLKEKYASSKLVIKFSRPILKSDPVDSIDAQNSAEIMIYKYAHLGAWEPLNLDDFSPIYSVGESHGWLIMAARTSVEDSAILGSFSQRVKQSPVGVEVEKSAVGLRCDGKLQLIDYGAPFHFS